MKSDCVYYRKGKWIRSYGEERRTRFLARMWGQGFVDVRKTDGSPKLASYFTKYFYKLEQNLLLAPMRMFRCSKGFPKPDVYYYPEEEGYPGKEGTVVWEKSFRYFGRDVEVKKYMR